MVAFDADGPGHRDRREARRAAVELCGHRALLPRRHARPSAPRAVQPSPARRAGDHRRCWKATSHEGTLQVETHGPRLCLARHRHPWQPAGRRQLRAHPGGAAGPADRLPRGDRLRPGLDHARPGWPRGRGCSARTPTAAIWRRCSTADQNQRPTAISRMGSARRASSLSRTERLAAEAEGALSSMTQARTAACAVPVTQGAAAKAMG